MNKLNVSELLSSKEFEKNVAAVAYTFGYTKQDEAYQDLRQAAAIAVVESCEKFDPEKSNSNFWGYTYLRLKEYVKREVNNQRNVVHIPSNHLNSAFKNYENITHSYSSLNYEDGNEVSYTSSNKDVVLGMDLKNAIDRLPSLEKMVIKYKVGLEPTISGGVGYKDIAETMQCNINAVMKLYKQAIKTLKVLLEN